MSGRTPRSWLVLPSAALVLAGLWWLSRASPESSSLVRRIDAAERTSSAADGRTEGRADGPPVDRRPARSLAPQSPGGASSFELSLAPAVAEATALVRVVLRDPAGRPAEGVVAALEIDGTDRRSGSISDAGGELRFEGVEARVALRFTCGGGDWIRQELPVAPLAPGEQRDLGSLALCAGHTLRGEVRDPEGAPAARARVSLVPRPATLEAALDPAHDLAWDSRASAETTSDAQGGFVLRGVPDGTYSVLARTDGAWAVYPRALRLPEDGSQPVLLDLAPGQRLSCRVLDEEGRPLAGSRVARLRHAPELELAEALRAIAEDGIPTDAEGTVVIDLPPGKGRSTILACAEGRVPSARTSSKSLTQATIQLPLAHTLRGRATDSRGSPLALAVWEIEATPRALPKGLLVALRTSADPAGVFAFDGLPAGTYRLHLQASSGRESFGPFEVPSQDGPDGALEIQVRSWRPLIVRALDVLGSPLAGATVEAHPPVLDEGRAPVRGSPRRMTTDSRGEAGLADLVPGTWILRASRAGLVSSEVQVEIGALATEQVELVLEPGGTLVVEVRDASGAAVPRARLQLERSGAALAQTGALQEADAFGRASWSGLCAGAYEVVHAPQVHRNELEAQLASAPSLGASSRLRADVLAGHVTQARLVLSGEPVLRVRVTRGGRAVPGAEVDLARCGEPAEILWRQLDSEGAVLTDGDGRACLIAPAPGCYLLQARSSSQSPASTLELDLSPGSSSVEIELAAGRVSGRVLDGRLGPLGAAPVHLVPRTFGGMREVSLTMMLDGGPELPFELDPSVPADQEFRVGEVFSRTDAQGLFEFVEVPPGTYTVEVASPGYAPWSSDDFELEPQRALDLGDLSLEPSCRLEGLVRGLTDRVQPGQPGVARLYTLEGRHVAIAVFGGDGSFELAPIPPGPHELRIELEGSVVHREQVEILPGRNRRLEIDLP